MSKTRLMLWLKKKVTRRSRLLIASASIPVIIAAALIALSGLLPGYVMTLGSRLSIKTPAGFTVGNIYDLSGGNREEPGYKTDSLEEETYFTFDETGFEYLEAASLGGPYYMDNELVHSMDFKLKDQAADGLIQILNLPGTLSDILDRTVENSNISYETFKTSKSEVEGLDCVTWDYVFKSGGESVHGLEAFFEYEGCLYRVSLFIPEDSFNEHSRKTFSKLAGSVSIN